MIDKFTLMIDGVNVTSALDKKTFPKWIKDTLKQASPFRFTIIRGATEQLLGVPLAREMLVKIYKTGTGEILLNGFIDLIGDKTSRMPQLTVYPNALLLKDTRPGVEKNLNDLDWVSGDLEDDSAEIVREFDSDGTEHIRAIVQKMLTSINTQKGTIFSATADTIPDYSGTGQSKFFGNILEEIDQSAWWIKLLGPIAILISWLTEDDYQIRLKNGTYYLVKRDFGIFQKLWIVAGGLLNVSPSLSISKGWLFQSKRLGIYVPGSNITLFNWGRWTIPGDDWTLPNIGVQIEVSRMVAGGLDPIANESISVFPQPDFSPSSSDMTNRYGSVVNPNSSANISSARIRAFLDEEGYQGDQATIISRFDYDARNTYAIVRAQKKKNDLSGSTLLLSFETTFDDYYEIHYRDEKGSGILEALCAVSNRVWRVDTQDRVYLTPRSATGDQFTINMNDVSEFKQTEQKTSSRPVNLKRYEEDKNGKVLSRGIRLRKNEYESILNTLEALQEGGISQTNVELIHRSGYGVQKTGMIDGSSVGQVIERSRNLYNPLEKLKLEEAL